MATKLRRQDFARPARTARVPARFAPRTGRPVAPERARATLPGVIAVVGCDGTGKTTLVRDVVAMLGKTRPIERRYMGLVSGEAGDRIKRLPIVGVHLERRLAAKVRRAQDMERKVPGAFTAIVMYLFSLWRVFQMRRLVRLSRRGVLAIAERYPQAEVAGFHYDGPGIDAARSDGRLVRWLAGREQALYDRMAELRPSLVIRLLIDEDTAAARKADHPLAELRQKILTMPGIRYNGARIVEIDARMPYAEVLDAMLRAIATAS